MTELDLLDDSDRIDCPFCGKMQFPGSATSYDEDWEWQDKDRCQHLVFFAVSSTPFTGFEFRSKLFNRHFNLSDSPDQQVEIPSKEDPERNLWLDEIIERLEKEMPGLVLRGYEDLGGLDPEAICGSTKTYGFVPGDASQ